jgi:ABC-type proline/glycine betaine transport system permease subunit
VVYGGIATKSGNILSNIIAINDFMIFLPFVSILTLVMLIFALMFLFSISQIVFYSYGAIIVLLLVGIIRVGRKLKDYTKADSQLSKAIVEVSGE